MVKIKVYFKKLLLLFQYGYLVFLSLFSKREEENCVLMDLSGLLINRRPVQAFLQLRNTGYRVYFRISPREYVNSRYYGGEDYRNFLFEKMRLFSRRKHYDVVFCAKERAPLYPKRIVFDDNAPAFGKHCEGHFFYPILFHPLKLRAKRELEWASYPLDTKIGMVFIGNNGEAYSVNEETFHQKYHIETRSEVIDFLAQRFSDVVFRPENKEQLTQKLFDGTNDLLRKIVIVDRFRLDGKDYNDTLSISAYHLWTSGYIQPFCHNQAESMACGCIPVYNESICFPGLTEENSYSYKNLEELACLVQKILDSGFEKAALLKKRAAIRENYYNNLSLKSFEEKMRSFLSSDEKEEIYYICSRINAG